MISFISHLMFGWAKLLGSDPFITPSYAKRLFCNRLLSTKKAEEELGYSITPMTKGLAKTMEDIGFSPAARPGGDLPDGTLPALFS